MRALFIFILVVLMASCAYGLSVSPGQNIVSGCVNESIRVITEGSPKVISIRSEGPLQDLIMIPPELVFIEGEKEKKVWYSICPPTGIIMPGEHDTRIIFSESVGEGNMAVALEVGHIVRYLVPTKGAGLLISLSAKAAGDDVVVSVPVSNPDDKMISGEIVLKVYTSMRRKVAEFKREIELNPLEEKVVHFSITARNNDTYKAIAKVDFEGGSSSAETRFVAGTKEGLNRAVIIMTAIIALSVVLLWQLYRRDSR